MTKERRLRWALHHALHERRKNSDLIRELEKFEAENEILRKKATTDSLTGLFNRGEFDRQLKIWVGHTLRSGLPTGLLMVDVDYFKNFNDLYGHFAGDKVLQHLSRALMSHIRGTDAAFRYGGEEFALLLPETGSKEASDVALRLHELATDTLQNNLVAYPDFSNQVTISMGVATSDELESVTGENLIQTADKYLYKAKESGRNRVAGLHIPQTSQKLS